tara:strand:- start:133 stop:897 length:765 start_codon:yes stop_codon:yes gene_type:complete
MTKKISEKIDIIIPYYNSKKYIYETLESVFLQSYQNFNILLINDFSNEEVPYEIRKFDDRLKILNLKKNMGPAFARNLGLRRTNSKYVCFLDSDDVWKKNKLLNQINFMTELNLDFSYTFYETIDEYGSSIGKVAMSDLNNFNKFIRNTSISTSSMMVKRSYLKQLKFKKKGFGFDDYIFKAELLMKNGKSLPLKEFQTIYRVRKSSISSNRIRNCIWIWKINRNYFKLNFTKNLISLISIGLNSLMKYKLKKF